LLGFSCIAALHFGWLEPKWSGVLYYVWPLVIWQGSACLSAAFSHRPFESRVTEKYSLACIALASVQGVVLFLPISLELILEPHLHLSGFVFMSSLGLLVLTAWMAQKDE
jgi:hypothetical protein